MQRSERPAGLQSPIRAATAAPARPEARPIGSEALKPPPPRLGRVAKDRLSPTGQRLASLPLDAAAEPLPAPSVLSSLYSKARALTVAGKHTKSETTGTAAKNDADGPFRRSRSGPRQICGAALNDQPVASQHLCHPLSDDQLRSCRKLAASLCHLRLAHSWSLLSRPSRH